MVSEPLSPVDLKVSVIIPTYGRPLMLQRAVVSVLQQTYSSIELIVVDDNDPGTTARMETEQTMAQYVRDARVVYLRHDRNRNGAAARNTGIKASTGELITFLDDDDIYAPNKVKLQVAFLNVNPDLAGVYCGRMEKGQPIQPTLSGDLTTELLLMHSLTTPALMFRREAVEVLKGFDESYTRHQDYEFLLRYFRRYTIGVISEVLVFIGDNQGENAKTSQAFEDLKTMFLGQFDPIITELDKKGLLSKVQVYSCHYAPVFCSHLRRGHLLMAGRVYFMMFFKAPLFFNRKILDYGLAYLRYLRYQRGDRA